MATADTSLPRYACAVIQDRRGRLLLQLRPAQAAIAAGQLTCFGGRREAGEDASACLTRELQEELGLTGIAIAPPLARLRRGGELIATFHPCRIADAAWAGMQVEPGFSPIWAPWPALPGLPLSAWHGQVLQAVRAAHGEAMPAAPWVVVDVHLPHPSRG